MSTCYATNDVTKEDESAKNFQQVLALCEKSASVGYRLARKQKKNLNSALEDAQEKVGDTLYDFKNSTCYSPEATTLLEEQLVDIEKSFGKLSASFDSDLKRLHSNMSKFSITLFGRTMTGKSTLMEVLTEGDGSSIGKGAQRTTRDIRKYMWNNLEITDVPGIGAFKGVEDDQIAFEEAKTADLILFLITDDAPQAIEAEWLSRIIDIGKPVICVVNVKAAITEGKSIKLVKRDIEKKFDKERLKTIQEQFLRYARQYGQKWRDIPFVYVHLKSAYLANQAKTPDEREIFNQLSKIEDLKSMITDLVKTKGMFFRIKTFNDIIANPMLEFSWKLLEQSSLNSTQGRTILTKKRKLEEWEKTFYSDAQRRISSQVTRIKSELNSEISAFAEEHFDDKNADKAWNKFIEKRNVETRCKNLLKNLEYKVDDKLKELAREIGNELKFATACDKDTQFSTRTIIDGKRIWDWSATVAGGGLSIAAGIAYLVGAAAAGPLFWVALGVTIVGLVGSFFFKNRDKKEYEARTRLEKKLRESVSTMCDSIEKQMEKNLNKLMRVKLHGLLHEMDKINSVIFRLADTQRELAWELNDCLLELNSQLVTEAIRLIGAEGLEKQINAVARIPGRKCVFLLEEEVIFPAEHREALRYLMGEDIYFVHETDSQWLLISRVLGKSVDRKQLRIEEKIGVAHIPVEKISPDMLTKIQLAQQLSKIHIINK